MQGSGSSTFNRVASSLFRMIDWRRRPEATSTKSSFDDEFSAHKAGFLLRHDSMASSTDPGADSTGRRSVNSDPASPSAMDSLIQEFCQSESTEPLQQSAVLSEGRFTDHYEMLEQIGKGTFSIVHKCRSRKTGAIRAVKIVDTKRFRLSNSYRDASLLEEVRILQSLKHRHIISLFEVFGQDDKLFIITEFAAHGELFDCIVSAGNFSEAQTRTIMCQTMLSIQHLHRRGIIHRDLKPENLLVVDNSPDTGIVVKVADFGVARHIGTGGSSASTFCGSPQYCAPEVLFARDSTQAYGKPVDVWSLGVILYVMLCGYLPFEEADAPPGVSGSLHSGGGEGGRDRGSSGGSMRLSGGNHRPLSWEDRIRQGLYEFAPPVWTHISSDAKQLIRRMLHVNPEERYTIEQCLAHPWFDPIRELANSQLFSSSSMLAAAAMRRLLAPQVAALLQGTLNMGALQRVTQSPEPGQPRASPSSRSQGSSLESREPGSAESPTQPRQAAARPSPLSQFNDHAELINAHRSLLSTVFQLPQLVRSLLMAYPPSVANTVQQQIMSSMMEIGPARGMQPHHSSNNWLQVLPDPADQPLVPAEYPSSTPTPPTTSAARADVTSTRPIPEASSSLVPHVSQQPPLAFRERPALTAQDHAFLADLPFLARSEQLQHHSQPAHAALSSGSISGVHPTDSSAPLKLTIHTDQASSRIDASVHARESRAHAGSGSSVPAHPPLGLSPSSPNDLVHPFQAAARSLDFHALTEMQERTASWFRDALVALRGSPEASGVVRKHAIACRQLHNRAIKIIEKFQFYARSVRSVVEDLQDAVREDRLQLVQDLFEQVKQWVSVLKADAEQIQEQYAAVIASVQSSLEHAHQCEDQADASVPPRSCEGPAGIGMDDSYASGPPQDLTEVPGSMPADAILDLLHGLLTSEADRRRIRNLLAARSTPQHGARATTNHTSPRQSKQRSWSDIVAGKSPHVDSAPPHHHHHHHHHHRTAPRVERLDSDDSTDSAHVFQADSTLPRDTNALAVTGNERTYVERRVQGAASGRASGAEQGDRRVNDECLTFALKELRQIGGILEECVDFWGSMELVVGMLVQRKEHISVLLRHSPTEKLAAKASMRLKGYAAFWDLFCARCQQYVEHARGQGSSRKLYSFL